MSHYSLRNWFTMRILHLLRVSNSLTYAELKISGFGPAYDCRASVFPVCFDVVHCIVVSSEKYCFSAVEGQETLASVIVVGQVDNAARAPFNVALNVAGTTPNTQHKCACLVVEAKWCSANVRPPRALSCDGLPRRSTDTR